MESSSGTYYVFEFGPAFGSGWNGMRRDKYVCYKNWERERTVKFRECELDTSTGEMVCTNCYQTQSKVSLTKSPYSNSARTSWPVYSPTVHTPISERSGSVPSSSHWTVQGFEAWHVEPEEGFITYLRVDG